jgi:hypothetical protein
MQASNYGARMLAGGFSAIMATSGAIMGVAALHDDSIDVTTVTSKLFS